MSKQLQYEKEFDALHCVSRLYAAEIQTDECSLVHHELLLESLQQEKSSSALSGAQPHKCLNYD